MYKVYLLGALPLGDKISGGWGLKTRLLMEEVPLDWLAERWGTGLDTVRFWVLSRFEVDELWRNNNKKYTY